MEIVKAFWIDFIRSIFIAMGAIWLPLEAFEGLSNKDALLPFGGYLILSFAVGALIFVIDGFFLTGYLKSEITIRSNSFDTGVCVRFGDLFEQEGWKAIAVNDFFDHIVDDDLVSSRSLHGQAISKYWDKNPEGWHDQIFRSLENEQFEKEVRQKGNKKRYALGTTAIAENLNQRFLFVALGKTNTKNNEAIATSENLICAVRSMLAKARSVCANEPLNIPLFGSGLSRVGIKNALLVDLILIAIFEETKKAKITDKISIILPKEKRLEISLGSIKRDWN